MQTQPPARQDPNEKISRPSELQGPACSLGVDLHRHGAKCASWKPQAPDRNDEPDTGTNDPTASTPHEAANGRDLGRGAITSIHGLARYRTDDQAAHDAYEHAQTCSDKRSPACRALANRESREVSERDFGRDAVPRERDSGLGRSDELTFHATKS